MRPMLKDALRYLVAIGIWSIEDLPTLDIERELLELREAHIAEPVRNRSRSKTKRYLVSLGPRTEPFNFGSARGLRKR